MDHGERQSWIAALLTDWRKNSNAAVSNIQDCFAWLSIFVSDLNAMPRLQISRSHFMGNRMLTVSSQTIDASPHQEMRFEVSGGAKQFVDVALAITDMDASLRVLQ